MTFISNAQHQAFCKSAMDELSGLDPLMGEEQVSLLEGKVERCLREMEQLHAEYQQHLQALQHLIRQYETVRKEARITLRRCLAAHRNENLKRMKALKRHSSNIL